ncbi:hypothetical protein [Pararhizobium haloflavum]|uniref:hypothetical protein n=1 Tax=Pararhizobium haloflavum TaxID=2037914 RepID=UPI0012FFE186|nr:hypothetical protein [Pararhizobium haloflavum]
MPERLDPQEARQGSRGVPVLKVLIVALVLALLAWAGAALFGETSDPEQPTGENTIQEDATDEPATGAAPTVD